MPAPLPRECRQAIADDIREGSLGCNAIARKHGVSPSTVSGIARREGLWFERCIHTATAADARRYYAAAQRAEREHELLTAVLELPTTHRRRDGRETRALRRLDYKLYDLNRHHSRTLRRRTT